ncbi:septal ring lytic transglycosylase RlpA family protein [Thalassotalea sp. G2M2-11]|uniref:septal ring lytic transglycosylase RlpA family protein n=1 Tax=Thalassotalea sp. G2M2-11 TaxID=2787627 RepID=UPI0019CFBD7C|nr:septal ring lytic transglycosylase RlpA family protein [Thalassotalea sp. G2M2-11]
MFNKPLIIISIILFLHGCSSQYGRYQQRHDSTPTRQPTSTELRDAIPRAEAKSRGGNSNYQVRGKHYQVLSSAKNFKEHGVASWYGNKFHGHLTSNGEIYNMYGMSAAHKNLPLPTYVKVTNKANNKSVIVRVNDRGPFHQNRIIDLSYSAAYKLDMLTTGTANVVIEAITDFNHNPPHIVSKPAAEQIAYIQVFATQNTALADKTANAITSLYQLPTKTIKKAGLYKVQVGPIKGNDNINSVLSQLKSNGYPNAFKTAP